MVCLPTGNPGGRGTQFEFTQVSRQHPEEWLGSPFLVAELGWELWPLHPVLRLQPHPDPPQLLPCRDLPLGSQKMPQISQEGGAPWLNES